MAKKYLTLEEAAHLLGMAPDELVRLRERGEIRGFADRGTWKFKSEDVEEFGRSRDADSSPEVPILDDTPKPKAGKSPLAADSGLRAAGGSGRLNKASDSDVRLLLDDSLVSGSKDSDPEVVLSQLGTSDSDVRLVEDVGGLVDSGSDSDVKLISTSSTDMVLPSDGSSSDASDSDVQLVGTTSSEINLPAKGGSSADASDSDVKLVAPAAPADSDSDVRLAPPSKTQAMGPRSDSDVRLVGTDDLATVGSASDMRLAPGTGSSVDISRGSGSGSGSGKGLGGTSSMVLTDSSGDESSTDESSVLLGDSGIALDTGSAMKVGGGSSADSGITLQSLADSGISLEKADSGISLAGPADSGIALDADSGISLEREDSGIALEGESGIRLADSGVKPPKKKKAEPDQTAPLVNLDDEEDSTQVEVPTMDEDEEEGSYKLSGAGKDSSKTNVVLFAEDDDEEAAPAAAPKGKRGRPDDSFALQEESGVEFAEAEDFSDDADLEVAEDVLTEEGDLDEIDVFEPAEEDFDSSAQSGTSHSEVAPAITLRSAVPVETPWDGLTFAGLCVSSVFLLLAGTVMFDLVRTMWYWDQNVVVGGALLEWVKGMF
jgi:excisionase family DNA binding protein